eukprot:Em0012g60a
MAELITFWVYSFVIPGLCTFTLTPINTTVCSGSTVQFVCSATDVSTVSYSLNSKPIPPLPPNVYISAPTVIGGAVVVHMSISNASANAVITCHAYLVNGTVLTRAAYLTVQGPPSPTTNLNITTYNGTATLLVWGPPPDAQSPSLLSYAVVIRNGSGAPVYSETLFGMMCSYTMVAKSGFEVLSFSHVKFHSLSHEDQSTITVFLPPNKHFNLTITAYNGYGNTSTTVVISTFDVVGVSVNTSSLMGLVCLFNTGSLARGCLVYLTDTDTGVTYCRVVWRSLDIPVDMSLCPSCNGPLSTGVYSVEVYDIERDGSVSSVPALAGEIVTVFGPSTAYGPSVEDIHHVTSSIGAGIGAGVGGTVMATASVMILVLCLVKMKKEKTVAQKADPLTTPNAVYGIVVKCSDDPTTADNLVYGARIDATMETR